MCYTQYIRNKGRPDVRLKKHRVNLTILPLTVTDKQRIHIYIYNIPRAIIVIIIITEHRLYTYSPYTTLIQQHTGGEFTFYPYLCAISKVLTNKIVCIGIYRVRHRVHI